jgi:hypothetical protein
MDDDRLAQRLVAITQLAEQIDKGTLDLAVKIAPAHRGKHVSARPRT